MVVVVVVLAVLAAALGGGLAFEYVKAHRAAAQFATAESRAADAEGDAAQARADAEAAQQKATQAEDAARTAKEQAQSQEHARQNLDAKLQAAESRADVAERRTAEVEERLAGLTAAPTPAQLAASAPVAAGAVVDTGLVNPDLLWAFELVRTSRTWRYSVAVGPDDPSPFGPDDDPLRVAIEVEAAALREESGTEIGLDWDLPMRLDTSRSLIVLRASQETLAAAARLADTVVLGVLADGDDVVLTLRGPDADDPAIALPADALPAADGFERLRDGVRILGAAVAAYEG
ncbi:MAG TPA: hypothetical protein VHA73_12165 [Acidimicrobiales bacterium]|jgi:hypothetical protein|nr:hypothetical protein [Acidimicrobiales bacterium]